MSRRRQTEPSVKLVRTISEVREEVRRSRRDGGTIGLVPTMGYLHEGHLSLLDLCRRLTDHVVMSVYVNPLQFGPSEDFERYPRDLERDLAAAKPRGVDLVFAPEDRELYPAPPSVVVTPRRLADRLCGLSRPGHFEGVLTVVGKLFAIVQPDVAVFGQKDYQQALLIRRMVEDLNLPLRIEVAQTVRDPDGLAMSSRNEYLSVDGRRQALRIPRGLAAAVRAFRSGQTDPQAIRSLVLGTLEAGGGVDIEYVEVLSGDQLEPVERAEEGTVVAVAARVGSTRLIDNVLLGRPDPGLEALL